MFKDFSKRLQRDIKSLVDTRLQYTATLQAVNRSSPIVVNVVSHAAQRYAVWAGGSLFASMVRLLLYRCFLFLYVYIGTVSLILPHQGTVRRMRPERVPTEPRLWQSARLAACSPLVHVRHTLTLSCQ